VLAFKRLPAINTHFGLLGVLGLVLAAIGIDGVMSYTVHSTR
jgi:hypothetical protein